VLASAGDAFVASSEASRAAFQVALEDAIEQIQSAFGKSARPWHAGAPQLVTIPLGVDHEALKPRDSTHAKALLGISPSSTVVLYVGRFSEMLKADLEPLLMAFGRVAKTADVYLILAGQDVEGRYSRQLEVSAAQCGLTQRVRLIPNFPFYQKAMIYAAADIFVSPVDNVQESFGLALTEAMAAGLPVICSDWSGYRELVTHGDNGMLVPTYVCASGLRDASWVAPIAAPAAGEHLIARHTIVDVSAMTASLQLLVDRPELRKRMGAAGRARVEQTLSWQAVSARYADLWAEQVRIAGDAPDARSAIRTPLYERMYRHYPTALLDDGVELRAADDAEQLIASLGSPLQAEAITWLRQVVEACRRRRYRIGDFVKPHARLERDVLLWALKKGVLQTCDSQTSVSENAVAEEPAVSATTTTATS
jgi:D-inositol-3-phosphate glycosyltransferase